MLKKFAKFMSPLARPRFLAAFCGAAATVLLFDILWCALTTFRALNFAATYLNAFLLAALMSVAAICSRRNWPQWLVTTAVAMLMVANLMYCRTYFNAIPLASYALVGNVMGFTSSIVDSFSPLYLLLFLPGAVAWIVMARNPESKEERRGSRLPWLLATGVLGLASTVAALACGGFATHVAKLRQGCYYATTPPVVYTPFGSLLADLLESKEEISDRQRGEVTAWFASQDAWRQRITSDSDTTALPERKNLVVIFCESLEAWPIEARVEGKEITPCLNRELADTASVWYARRVLSQVGNGRSIEGQLLVLTGLYPMRDLVYSMRHDSNRYPSLPDAMKRRGASTWLLSGDAPSTWNQARIAATFGIDSLLMGADWEATEKIGHPARLSDRAFVTQIVERMKRGEIWREGERKYLQVVTYTGHNPFKIPQELRTINLQGKYPEKFRDYVTAASYTDAALGTLLQYLRSRSDWGETMVVIVGDHEALATWRDEIREVPELARIVDAEGYVPMIVLNAPRAGRREDVMGQVDVYSTILDQMRLPYAWKGMGFSALNANAPRFAVARDGRRVALPGAAGDGSALQAHVDSGPAVSDITIRFNLLKDN